MKRSRRWLGMSMYAASGIGLVAAIAFAFMPRPVSVEAQPVVRGPLQVTVDEDGKTRIKEKYVVSAPLDGRLSRVQLHAGDPVVAGQTLLASFDPVLPDMLDARELTTAQEHVKAAEATQQQTNAAVERARVTVGFAEEEFLRAKDLNRRGSVPHEEMDRMEMNWRVAQEDLRSALFAEKIAEHELAMAQAALVRANGATSGQDESLDPWRFDIRSPIDGRVLRVFQESAAVVKQGDALMELGDPRELEVVVDVLSNDAVRIVPGNVVEFEEWGGDHPLQGRVRLVEPAGFTKLSALGVEEQRVNVIIDLVGDPETRRTLGDGFRVEAKVVVSEAHDVLKVPNGALFRFAEDQALFVVEQGRASVRKVTLGLRGRLESEVASGLLEGELVVIYPSDKVRPGVKVSVRQ